MKQALLACVLCAGLVAAAANAQAGATQNGSRVSGADANRSVSGAGINPRVSGAPYPMPDAPSLAIPPLVTQTERTPPVFVPETVAPSTAPAAPQGRAIFRFGYGDTVPAEYLDRRNRVEDYAHYDLVAPPAGMVWVRVGKDAVLVDLNTNTVVSAGYNAFH